MGRMVDSSADASLIGAASAPLHRHTNSMLGRSIQRRTAYDCWTNRHTVDQNLLWFGMSRATAVLAWGVPIGHWTGQREKYSPNIA